MDEVITGRWDDVDAARRLASGAGAVTLEIEQIGVMRSRKSLASPHCDLPSSPSASFRTRHCKNRGSPSTGFLSARSAWCVPRRRLYEALPRLGGRVFLKVGRGGYDGRGQVEMQGTEVKAR